MDQGCGIDQLIHRLTVATTQGCSVRPGRPRPGQVWPCGPGVAATAVTATAGLLLRELRCRELSYSGEDHGTSPGDSRPRNGAGPPGPWPRLFPHERS